MENGKQFSTRSNRGRVVGRRGRCTAYVPASASAAFQSCICKVTDAGSARLFSPSLTIPADAQRVTVDAKAISEAVSPTTYINNWVNCHAISADISTATRFRSTTDTFQWHFKREIHTKERIVSVQAISMSLRNAKTIANYALKAALPDIPFHLPTLSNSSPLSIIAQGEGEAPKESDQGLAIQASDKESNTIVTRDEGHEESSVTSRNECVHYASSEPSGSFELITKRWMPLDPLTVSTSNGFGTIVGAYYLPETLYSLIANSANLVPFETFVYAEVDISMKFVVNANKFQCGKVVASAKFDSYQCDAVQSSVRTALHRPHVILDLASNNEGELHIPFRYHRALMRITGTPETNRGVRPSKYASVFVQVLSPLRTGTDNATDMFIRPFVKLENIRFCGMSHRVTLQMESLAGSAGSAVLRSLLSGAESLLTSDGTTPNRDKPTENRATLVVPRPRYNFATGKGPTDALQLRMDPTTMTSYNCVQPYEDDPKSTLSIAQIWGLRSTFTWANSNSPGTLLYEFVVDPSCRQYADRYVGVPTPLEYVTSLYNFWSGTIEMRLDFVSNAFHTGAVQIAVEFNRPTDSDDNEKRSASSYTKTFHLGEQKSVHMTIPYIYDTVWRRSCTLPYNPALAAASVRRADLVHATALYARSRTTVSIRVLNDLRPVSTAPQEIDVLLFWKASPSYRLHSLKQSSFYFARESAGSTRDIDDFPPQYAGDEGEEDADGTARRRKREVNDADAPPADLDDSVANQYNEYNPMDVPTEKDYAFEPTDDDGIETVEPQGEVIKLQMDSGEKENQDTTLDFAMGLPALNVQTVDAQHNIKDILRRPTLLMHRVTVTGLESESTNGFFIPLMAPSRNMAIRSTNPGTLFSDAVGQTPQAQLMSLFRFWRGSMRYTIVVDTPNFTQPVYVTHIPHSGVRFIGNQRIGFQVQGRARDVNTYNKPIYAVGLTTEMMIPSVNPTIQVEVPFDTENNWCLTYEDDPGRRYTWRDKGDTNTGHLVVTCQSDVTISVWWSAGDDFEFANFYGIPACVSNDTRWALPDIQYQIERATDFRIPDDLNPHSNFLFKDSYNAVQNIATTFGVNSQVADCATTACVSQLPVLGPLYVAWKGAGLAARVESAATHFGELAANVNARCDVVSTKISALYTKFESVFASFAKSCPTVWSVKRDVCDFLLDFATSIILRSWEVMASSLVRLLSHVMDIPSRVAELMAIIPSLAESFRRWLQPTSDIVAQGPAGPSEQSTLAGLLISVVSLSFGVVFSKATLLAKVKRLYAVWTDARSISYVNQVIRLFHTVFDILKDLIFEAVGMVSPEAASLKLFAESAPFVNEFIKDAQLVTCEANINMMSLPQFRTKFWLTMTNAYQIQSVLCTLPSQAASSQLARLCSEVIRVGNDRMVDLTACPVRFEPFTLCMEGAPGIGKSHLNEFLCASLLRRINFTRATNGLIYVRQPGAAYWSGYRDQPVITYDDMFNINDKDLLVQSLKELYQLKSPSIFIPDMAHLEDKRIRGNPLIVTMLCNDAYPSHLSNVAIDKEAVYRRRDVLIRARLKPPYTKESVRNLPPDVSGVMGHLEFSFHRNPRHSHAGYEPEWYSYEQLVEILSDSFEKYYNNEMANVRRRLRELQSILSGIPADQVDLSDPFRVFWDSQATRLYNDKDVNAWLPSEQLNLYIKEASAKITEAFKLGNAIPETEIVKAQGPIVDTALSIGQVVDGLLSVLKLPSTRCAKCKRHGPIALSCKSPENYHNYCPCCAVEMPNQRVCTLCQAPTCYRGRGPFSRALIALAKFTEDEYAAVTAALVKLNPIELSRLVASFVLASCAADMSGVPGAGLAVTVGAYTSYVYNRKRVHTSVPDEDLVCWAYAHDEYLPVRKMTLDDIHDKIRVIEVNTNRYQELLATAHPTSACLHHHVLLAMDDSSTSYVSEGGGTWRCIDPSDESGGWLTIPDRPCSNYESCPLMDEQEAFKFYTAWGVRRYAELANLWKCYLTNVGYAPCYRERIPLMLRPDWMTPFQFSFTSSWWEFLSDKYEKYKNLIYVIVAGASVCTAVYGLSRMFSTDNDLMEIQSKVYAHENTKHLKRVHKSTHNLRGKIDKAVKSSVKPQWEEQQNAVRTLVHLNYITIRVWNGDILLRTLGGLGLCGKVAVLPKHYALYIQSASKIGRKITVERSRYLQESTQKVPENHTRHTYTSDDKDWILHETTDLALWSLPASFSSFRDIRKHVALDEDVNGYLPSSGYLEVLPNSLHKFIESHSVNVFGVEEEVETTYEKTVDVIRDVITYSFSREGACGSALVLDRTTRPIFAIHCAGSTSRPLGYGTIITQELLAEMMPSVNIFQMEEATLESFGDRQDSFVLDLHANVEYIGVVPRGQEHFSPVKTKLRPSLVQGVGKLKPLTEPTVLSIHDKRWTHPEHPLYYGCSKHGLKTLDPPTSLVERATDALWNGWFSAMRPSVLQPKVLTYEEAVLGLEDVPFYEPMKLPTSSGYPYTVLNPKDTSKEAWIHVERDENMRAISATIDPRVIADIESKNELRRRGIQPLTIFADTLKDERKDPSKVRKAGGTRVFCASPIDYTIVCRQMFLHFGATFSRARFDVMSGVGINAKGLEWSDLYHHLRSIGSDNIVELDYSNFGPGFNAVLGDAAAKIINRWSQKYVHGYETRLGSILLSECTNSVHIARNTVYQQHSGSPSGAPLTTIINSVVNLLHVAIAWIVLAEPHLEPDFDLWDEFKRNIRLVVYGDDLIMNVTDAWVTHFNACTIRAFFAKFNIVATGTDKTGEETNPRISIKDCRFLKRGFLAHPTRKGVWLSPLKWSSVNDASQWIWSCADHRAATIENCMSALHEAHGHGPAKYNEFLENINDALRDANLKHSITTSWDDLDRLYFGDHNATVCLQMESETQTPAMRGLLSLGISSAIYRALSRADAVAKLMIDGDYDRAYYQILELFGDSEIVRVVGDYVSNHPIHDIEFLGEDEIGEIGLALYTCMHKYVHETCGPPTSLKFRAACQIIENVLDLEEYIYIEDSDRFSNYREFIQNHPDFSQ